MARHFDPNLDNRDFRLSLFAGILFVWAIFQTWYRFTESVDIFAIHLYRCALPFVIIGTAFDIMLRCIQVHYRWFGLVSGIPLFIGGLCFMIASAFHVCKGCNTDYCGAHIWGMDMIGGVVSMITALDMCTDILKSRRIRAALISVLFLVITVLELVYYFHFTDFFVTDETKALEAGWILIGLASFICVIFYGIRNRLRNKTVNVIGGVLYALGGIITFISGIAHDNLEYDDEGKSYVCAYNAHIIFQYAAVGALCLTVAADVQKEASVVRIPDAYKRMCGIQQLDYQEHEPSEEDIAMDPHV